MKVILSLILSVSFAYAKEWSPDSSMDKHLNALKSKVKPTKDRSKIDPVVFEKGTPLEVLYKREAKNKTFFTALKEETLSYKQKAVPTLIKVMKSSEYPEENRWIATFMLGRIVGKKSAGFISRFTSHPNWMLRLASLKVLLHLKQDQFQSAYIKALSDKSLIVRHQALQNIKELNLIGLAPHIWNMLYDKSNYAGAEGNRKRTHIIRSVIKTVGDLKFKTARAPMLKMIQKNKYNDIHQELDYALCQLSSKDSPVGTLEAKRNFWSKIASSDKTI